MVIVHQAFQGNQVLAVYQVGLVNPVNLVLAVGKVLQVTPAILV